MADIPGNTSSRVMLPIGREVGGRHEFDDDADWYRVQLRGGTNYTFRASVFEDGDPDDEYAFAEVTLRDASGRVVARSFSDDYDGYVGGFDFRPAAGGTFFLAVESSAVGGHRVAFEVDEPAAPPASASIRPGETRDADLFSGGDRDTFSVRLEQGRAYDFALLENSGGTSLEVLDDRGRSLFDSYDMDEPPSDSFPDANAHVEDFRAPYTGTFYLRASVVGGPSFDASYSVAAAADADAPPWNPTALPTGDDDLLIGGLVAADRINALAGEDLVYGRGGNDDLQGGAGIDVVFGGDGDDLVFGGPDDDALYGEAGNDRLAGGFGSDRMVGGAGRDVFDLQAATRESIGDFARGQDRMDLSRIDANSSLAGDQAFTFIGTREPTGAGQLRYEYSAGSNTTVVTGFTNGDGLADFSVRLDGRIVPAAGDFQL